MDRIKRDGLYVLPWLLLWIIVAFRATTMSFTHDESGTYLFFHDKHVLAYLFDPALWTSANNHVLNTFLYQISIKLFGVSEWALRLPNVLAFGLYISCAWHLVKKTAPRMILPGMALICLNPYLLDFFSLCRGYGLGLGFQVFSLYFFYKYLARSSNKDLVLAMLGLALSAFSVFTNLMLIPAFVGSFWLTKILARTKKQMHIQLFVIPVLFMLGTAALAYIPISALSGIAEFRYGVPSIEDTFTILIRDSLMGRQYLGQSTIMVTGAILFIFIVLGAGTSINNFIKHRDTAAQFKLFAALAIVALICGFVASHTLLGTDFPHNRKSTLFIPLIGLNLLFALDWLSQQSRFAQRVPTIVAVLLILHTVYSLDLRSTRQWWYDTNTKEFITGIAESGSEPLSIGTSWLFHPTLTFYVDTRGYDHVRLAPYNKTLDTVSVYDYFLCFSNDIEKLPEDYTVVSKTKQGTALLKSKID